MNTYCKSARITGECDLELMQMILNELGKAIKFGKDFVKLTNHCKWEFKTTKDKGDTMLSILFKAEELKDE